MEIFTKKLTKTDVLKRISVPCKKLNYFPSFQHGCHAMELQVEDERGHVTHMRYSIRKRRHKKPVISRGWRRFAHSMNLDVGDKVAFYMVEREAAATKYKIKVKKAVKLFGAIIGYTPIHAV